MTSAGITLGDAMAVQSSGSFLGRTDWTPEPQNDTATGGEHCGQEPAEALRAAEGES